MDIEERVEEWADNWLSDPQYPDKTMRESLIAAYLAGMGQASRDYGEYRGRQVMDSEIPPATGKEVRRAARNHAKEMIRLHNTIQRVAVTAAKLTTILDRTIGAPLAGGARCERADVAMGQLDRAYEAVAALFEDL